MKPFVIIGRGKTFPIVVRFERKPAIVEYFTAYALVYHVWKWFGVIVLDNF